ncbi:hypothetical protein QTH47_03185 [Clostridium perfringens]|nr:hypothetical protein [Clostridium perfringens]HAT4352103.1 hypothetical protein [Clostridium perfringens]
MSKNKKYEIELVNNKRIINLNSKEYLVKTTLTAKFMSDFHENRNKCSNEELIKKCIVESNKEVENIIDKLKKDEVIYILNMYVESSNFEYSKINTYDEFIVFLEEYEKYCTKKLSESVTQIAINLKNTLDSTNIMGTVNMFTKNIAESVNWLNQEFSEKFSDIIKNIGELMTDIINNPDRLKLENAFDECKLLLIELGYPYVDIDIEDIMFISKHKEDENINEIIDCAIYKNYTDDVIDRMLEKWKGYSFICKRIHILEDAINAYKSEKYNLSIPVFFSQLEGTIADSANHIGRLDGRKYREYIDEIIKKNNDSNSYCDDIIKSYFFNSILQHFVHGNDIPNFSRHAILHGADVSYGTKINNLNIIITFDTMLEYIDNIKNSR